MKWLCRPHAVLLPLILASRSPRRRRILEDLGLAFESLPADVDETPPVGCDAALVAEKLALRKADAVAVKFDLGTVIGADTIVVGSDDRLLGKPGDVQEARRILSVLSGTTHRVITGVALLHRPTNMMLAGHETTTVSMRPMEQAEIDDYVATGEPFGKAGAYAIQERGDRFVTALAGDYDNVVGLPARRLTAMMDELATMVLRG